MSNYVALRRLVEFNPPVPHSIRLNSKANAPLLPMDSIRHFDPPDRGEKRMVESLLQGYSYVEPSDVAYAKVTPCFENGKGLVGADLIEPSFGSSELTVLRPNSMLDQRYLSYVLQSEPFRAPAIASMTGAGGLKRVNEQEMRALKVWTPTLSEQRAVTDHLDHETAEIDAFVADLQQMASLSQEEWRARRDQALSTGQGQHQITTVTSTWFSERAAHWQEGSLKFLFDISLGKMLDEGRHVAEDEQYPYVRAGDIGDGTLNLENLNRMPFSHHEQKKFAIAAGDLLVVEGGSVGTNVVLDRSLNGIYFQKTVNRMRSRGGAVPLFYSEVLNAYRESGVLDTVCNRSTIMHLTADKLGDLVVPVPPVDEQRSVATHLQTTRRQVEKLTNECRRAIDLANERRAAMISAAVTGQIDVTQRHKPVAEQLENEVLQKA